MPRESWTHFLLFFFLPIAALIAFLILDQQKVMMLGGHRKSGERGSLNTYKAHVMVLAYHGQDHINPMVQFSKRLASKRMKITVSTALSNTKAMVSASSSVTFESIYDDITEGGWEQQEDLRHFLTNIAKKFVIPGAAFLTQSRAAIASYYPMHYEILEKSLSLPALSMPGLPPPKIPYLPSLGAVTGEHSPIIRHICK